MRVIGFERYMSLWFQKQYVTEKRMTTKYAPVSKTYETGSFVWNTKNRTSVNKTNPSK